MQRRKFVHSIALGGIGIALAPIVKATAPEKAIAVKPTSNIQDALNIPRTNLSMPGKFPGKVVKINHPDCFINGKPSNDIAYEMVKTSMCKQIALHLRGSLILDTSYEDGARFILSLPLPE